jgi:hypothetical protein
MNKNIKEIIASVINDELEAPSEQKEFVTNIICVKLEQFFHNQLTK